MDHEETCFIAPSGGWKNKVFVVVRPSKFGWCICFIFDFRNLDFLLLTAARNCFVSRSLVSSFSSPARNREKACKTPIKQ